MRMMFLAFAAAIGIAVAADLALDRIGFSSQERLASDTVRIDG